MLQSMYETLLEKTYSKNFAGTENVCYIEEKVLVE